MEHIQQAGKEAASAAKKAAEVPGGDYQLSYSGAQQQFNSTAAEELAYNAIDRRAAYHKTQHAYDAERNRYTEAAFNDYREGPQGQSGSTAGTYDYERQSGSSPSAPAQQTKRPQSAGASLSGPTAAYGSPPPYGPSGPDPPGGGPLSGTAGKWGGAGFGTAEAPELWKRTNRIIRNDEKIEKLDKKRRYVRRGYTRLSVTVNGKEYAVRGRLRFGRYYNGKTY